MTPAQRRAVQHLLPKYGVGAQGSVVDWEALYGRRGPVIVEIGFGDGTALLEMAQRFPQANFFGIEVYRPGVGSLLAKVEREEIGNIRVTTEDAYRFLLERVAPRSVDELLILFPDPWPKKRHHKRRLIQPRFVGALSSALVPGGYLQIATDWPDYAEHIQAVLATNPALTSLSAASDASAMDIAMHPALPTKYERRGRKLGHHIHQFRYRKD